VDDSHTGIECVSAGRADAWTIIDGAEEALLVTKSAGFRNIILSNHATELPELVSSLGLASVIEQTITSATVGAEKPNPFIFTFAMTVAGVTGASEVWMIGDNPIADIEGAQNVGISAILADGTHSDAIGMTVLEAAHHVVRSHHETDR
jgi:putative hydrolase of the HAD superfamily